MECGVLLVGQRRLWEYPQGRLVPPSVKVLHLNVRLVQDDKGEYFEEVK